MTKFNPLDPNAIATAVQFVAEFFSTNQANTDTPKFIDYSDTGVCWNEWVERVYNAGLALEETIIGLIAFELAHKLPNSVGKQEITNHFYRIVKKYWEKQTAPVLKTPTPTVGAIVAKSKCPRIGGCLLENGMDSCCCQTGDCDGQERVEPTNQLCLELYHGRKHPDDVMEDWGDEGPIFLVRDNIQATYGSHIKFFTPDGKDRSLYYYDDMLYYDGIYYGDWSVSLVKKMNDGDKTRIVQFDDSKTTIPNLDEPLNMKTDDDSGRKYTQFLSDAADKIHGLWRSRGGRELTPEEIQQLINSFESQFADRRP